LARRAIEWAEALKIAADRDFVRSLYADSQAAQAREPDGKP
jgi:hypothetical protein